MNKIIDFLTSLKLTVVCLACGLVLVFIGTLAQVNVGLYDVQSQYFRQFILFRPMSDLHNSLPELKYVFPGGYLIGWFLFFNLVAAHIKRFKLTWAKSGIFLTHIGIILLLLGQFFTELFQVEGSMRIEEGGSKNYSNSHLDNELVLIDKSNGENDIVHSIPEAMVASEKELPVPETPFTFRVKKYFRNCETELRHHYMVQGEQGRLGAAALKALSVEKISASQGVGRRLTVVEKFETDRMDDRNIPAALVEVMAGGESKGDWLVTNWAADDAMAAFAFRVVGERYANLDAPQTIEHDGKTYEIAMRSVRQYKPHTIELVDFEHDKYQGTEKAMNFSSTIHLTNPESGEERKNIVIKMNHPLRYGGETYYQSSFEPGDKVTVLQVVRNPVWLTPYISCFLVGFGLLTQFSMHLMAFGKRRRKKDSNDSKPGRGSGGKGGASRKSRADKMAQKKSAKSNVPVSVPRVATGDKAAS